MASLIKLLAFIATTIASINVVQDILAWCLGAAWVIWFLTVLEAMMDNGR